MKTVLILAVYFPPSGGVGVIRTLKFVKYLPDFGWRPIVVTVPARSTKRISDPTLLKEIPDGIDIHRPFFFDYRKLVRGDIASLAKPILKRIHFPDKYVQWNRFALHYIIKHIWSTHKIDAIYASLAPHSTMLLAQRLKHRLKVPFLLDFRDPFSFSQYSLLDERTGWRHRARTIERSVFKDADGLNHVSPVWKARYEQLYPAIKPRSTLIYNGYDDDDFDGLQNQHHHSVFTIGYNGSISRLVPLDPLAAAIGTIHREKGIAMGLSIAGPVKEHKLKAAFPYLYQHGLIDFKGYLPHKQSLANLYQAHSAALILNDIAATEGMIPAKTFEYMRLGRPILLLHRKSGHLADLIHQTRSGVAVDVHNQAAIVEALLALHDQWRHSRAMIDPDWSEIQKFERRALTRELASVLDTLCRMQ